MTKIATYTCWGVCLQTLTFIAAYLLLFNELYNDAANIIWEMVHNRTAYMCSEHILQIQKEQP